MNYSDIQTVSYGYADRNDVETVGMFDNFLRIVESKINRHLKTLQATARVSLASTPDETFYGLPDDFNGMRNLQIDGAGIDGSNTTVTAQFRTPAQINETRNSNNLLYTDQIVYTIINEQLQIEPQLTNQTIEMVYYRKVPPLTTTNTTNWLGDDYPDCYVFGVITEISSFNKDYEAAAAWTSRFNEALSEIKENDDEIRWGSGDMLVTQTL